MKNHCKCGILLFAYVIFSSFHLSLFYLSSYLFSLSWYCLCFEVVTELIFFYLWLSIGRGYHPLVVAILVVYQTCAYKLIVRQREFGCSFLVPQLYFHWLWLFTTVVLARHEISSNPSADAILGLWISAKRKININAKVT